jgi:hypothetical protein
VRGRGRTLLAHLGTREALADAIRQANASVESAKVTALLVNETSAWFDATCWAVTGYDAQGQFVLLAEVGLTPGLGPGLWTIANWVRQNGVEFSSADLSGVPRAERGAYGLALGIPLICRGRVIGVLAAVDAVPLSAAPRGLTASIGVATLPDAAGSAEELLQAADTAMYKVKASGKDGIYIATAS